MKFEIGMEVLINGITWAVVDEIFDDGQNAITHDDRLQRWPIVRDLERFWVCEESGTESSVRALLHADVRFIAAVHSRSRA